MPKIPEVEAQGPGQADTGFQRASASEYGGGTARAIGEFSQILGQEAERVHSIYQDSKANQVIAGAQKKLNDYSLFLKSGPVDPDTGELLKDANGQPLPAPDPEDYARKYQARVDQIRSESEDQMGTFDGKALRKFYDAYEPLANRHLMDAQADGIAEMHQKARATLQNSLQTQADNFADAPDLAKPQIKLDAMKAINDAVKARQITPEQGFEYQKTFNHQADIASIRKIIDDPNAGPLAAVAAIKRGEFDIPADLKAKWTDIAYQRHDQKLRQATAALDYTDKKLRLQEHIQGEAAAKDGVDLADKGELTPEWLQKNKRVLPLSDYKSLVRQMKGDDTVSDKKIYDAFVTEIFQGQDKSAEIDEASENNQLSSKDHLELKKLAAEYSGTLKGNPLAKQDADYIHSIFGGEKSLRIPGEQAAESNAQKMFYRYVQKNPDASDEEREKQRDIIIDRVSRVNMRTMTTNLPTPKYIEGGRDALYGPTQREVLQKGWNKLFANKKNEDPDEFRREVDWYNAWFKNLPPESKTPAKK